MKEITGIQIDPADTVGIVLQAARAGDCIRLGTEQVTAAEAIPANHKVALRDIPVGEAVYKYGCPIGYATALIKRGEHVHVHNLDSEQMLQKG